MVNRNGVLSHGGPLTASSTCDRRCVCRHDREGAPGPTVECRCKWYPAELSRYFGLSADGTTFFMGGSHNGEVGALLALDLVTGSETVLASDAKYDVEDAFVHPSPEQFKPSRSIKISSNGEYWIQVSPPILPPRKLRGGDFTVLHPPYESPIIFSGNLGRRDLEDRTWIVSYENDDGPTHHYLYDRAAKTATLLFSERPALDDFQAREDEADLVSIPRWSGNSWLSDASRRFARLRASDDLLRSWRAPVTGPLGLSRHGPVARQPWLRRAAGQLPRLHGLRQEVRPCRLQRMGRQNARRSDRRRRLAHQRRHRRPAQGRDRRRFLWRLFYAGGSYTYSGCFCRRRE